MRLLCSHCTDELTGQCHPQSWQKERNATPLSAILPSAERKLFCSEYPSSLSSHNVKYTTPVISEQAPYGSERMWKIGLWNCWNGKVADSNFNIKSPTEKHVIVQLNEPLNHVMWVIYFTRNPVIDFSIIAVCVQNDTLMSSKTCVFEEMWSWDV